MTDQKTYPVNNDPRAMRTRYALRDALLKLLETVPFEQITIRDIVAEAGIGYSTFFRHHETKESLLSEVAAQQITNLINLSMPIMDAHDMRAASTALFSYVYSFRPLWSTLLTGGASGAIRDEFLRQARVIATNRVPSNSRLPTDLGSLLIVSGTIELLTWWLRQTNPLPVNQIAEIHDEVVVTPVIAATSAGIAS